MHDQFDVSLEDSDLLVEVEMTTNLIIAASESDEALSQDQIDAILGVVPQPARRIGPSSIRVRAAPCLRKYPRGVK